MDWKRIFHLRTNKTEAPESKPEPTSPSATSENTSEKEENEYDMEEPRLYSILDYVEMKRLEFEDALQREDLDRMASIFSTLAGSYLRTMSDVTDDRTMKTQLSLAASNTAVKRKTND